jgi:hypothetical protein
MKPNALALLLGQAATKAKAAAPAKRGVPEDLIKAVADFRAAPTDVDAADALLLAVQLASDHGNADVADEPIE